MIRIGDYRRIDIEVRNAVVQAFEFAQKAEKDKNDYYLFLSNATYIEKYKDSNISPYVIDYSIDVRIDEHRMQFLSRYLQSQYHNSQFNTADSKDTLSLEMMIYTHIWESRNFLKQLKKLNDLCMGIEYNWNTTIPEAANGDSKQSFIRDVLRDNFKAKGLDISKVITNGYRSQLRNAFAHSDYSFGLNDEKIDLHNYIPHTYMVESIAMDEWTMRFCHSFLLNYHLHNYYYEQRDNISSQIELFLRNKNGEKKKGLMTYDKERRSFQAKVLEP